MKSEANLHRAHFSGQLRPSQRSLDWPRSGCGCSAFSSSTSSSSSCSTSFSSLLSSSSFRFFVLAIVFLAGCASWADGQAHFFFKIKPKNHDVEEGKPVRLRCLANNNYKIRYHWLLNGKLLEMDSRRILDNSDLYIRKADAELDRGYFRCVATNKSTSYSQQTNKASINVFWLKPKVEVTLKEPARLQDIKVGGSLELHCKSRASPEVSPQQIFWFYNFQKLKPRIAKQVGVELLKNGNLRISRIKAGNVGIYRCQVMHPAGHVMSTRPFPLIFDNTSVKYNTSVKPEHFIKYVTAGQDLRLECPYDYSGTKIQFMQWFFKPSLDDTSSQKTFMRVGKCGEKRVCVLPLTDNFAFLRRKVRNRNEVGFYKCNPVPAQGKPYVIEVRLAHNPRLQPVNLFPNSKPGQPLVVVRGKDLTIRVYQDLTPDHRLSVVPDPPPKYSWFMPDGRAEVPAYSASGRQRIYKSNDRNLHINNAQDTDSGVYKFVANNLAGKRELNVTIVVAFPPKFSLTRMEDKRVEENKQLKLRCNVESKSQYPVARILWYKDNVRIPQTDRLKEDQREGTLTISNVFISDEETYKCAIQTQHIEKDLAFSEPFRLRVIKSLKILNLASEKFLQRNSQARIPCVAEGDGVPRIHWRRKSRIVSKAFSSTQPWQDSSGAIVFPQVLDAHVGNYTCVASNHQGTTNKTIQVIVGIRPTIHRISKNITVDEGSPVTLNCEAKGDPPPTISWLKKGRPGLDEHAETFTKDLYFSTSLKRRRVMFLNGSLHLRRALLKDSASYSCVAGNKYAMNSAKEVVLTVKAQNEWDPSGRSSNWSMTKTVIIVVGCAVAYLALIIGLTIYCSVRMLRNRQKRAAWALAKMEGALAGGGQENGRLLIPMPNGESQGLMSPDRSQDGGHGPGDSRSHFSGLSGTASGYTRSLRAGTPSGSLQDRVSTYPRHQLQTLGMLGKGEFGDVFLARAHNIREGEAESLVVIKAHHGGRSEALDLEFAQQMELFGKLDHDFIVKLLGVCREMEPEFMILEYCEWGDLKQFLKAMRQSDKVNERNVKIPPLTLSQKVTMCSQVALGMEHLSNYRYVHKDLAARNVLLTSTLDLKIANLGLCQDVYAGEYFPMRNKRLPLRWLPPEVIMEDAYSTKSDVWAFGILVCEVFTLGDFPHRRLTDLQVIGAAETHHLVPELPAQCPNELASLLRQCWADKPRERPSFNDISVIIGELTVDSDM